MHNVAPDDYGGQVNHIYMFICSLCTRDRTIDTYSTFGHRHLIFNIIYPSDSSVSGA